MNHSYTFPSLESSGKHWAYCMFLLLAASMIVLLSSPRPAPPAPAAPAVAPATKLLFTEQGERVVAGTLNAEFVFDASGMSLVGTNGPTLQVAFVGANPATRVEAVEPLAAVASNYQGDQPAQWSEAVPTYGAVRYDDLFAGISLHVTGDTQQLKGTYTVAAHADPAQIGWRYPGASHVQIEQATGDLHITLGGQTIIERAPIAWQETASGRAMVDVRFALVGDNAGFALGNYNPALPLVIDPELVYSSYVGGNSDEESNGIVRDSSGNLYLIGRTYSTDFGGSQNSIAGSDDIFIAKFDPTGKQLLYRTILGGQAGDSAIGIAVNAAGEVAFTGSTYSTDFPMVAPLLGTRDDDSGVFGKLDASGRLVFSSYINAFFGNSRQNIAFDANGNMVFVGMFDHAENYQEVGIYIIKGDGSAPVAARSIGGDWHDYGVALAIGPGGNLYIAGSTKIQEGGFPLSDNAFQKVCGAKAYGADRTYCDEDAFVAVMSPDASTTLYATFLGGAGTENVSGIGVDSAGNIYVAGTTGSADFPTRNAFQPDWLGADNFSNGFITRLKPDLSDVLYSTFFSSEDQAGSEHIYALAVDPAGNVAVTGLTNGLYLPVRNAVQNELDGRMCITTTERYCHDAFVAAFDPNGALSWSTYLGGDDDDQGLAITFDGTGGVWVSGQTEASDFATTTDATSRNLRMSDVFLTRLGAAPNSGGGTNQPYRVVAPMVVN